MMLSEFFDEYKEIMIRSFANFTLNFWWPWYFAETAPVSDAP